MQIDVPDWFGEVKNSDQEFLPESVIDQDNWQNAFVFWYKYYEATNSQLPVNLAAAYESAGLYIDAVEVYEKIYYHCKAPEPTLQYFYEQMLASRIAKCLELTGESSLSQEWKRISAL